MAGRRFPNGLVFDNFHITTVDGVKAGDEITIEDNAVTAQINLENTLQFSEDAPSIVKEIKMLNTVVSSDFRIKKYNIATDPLLLNGENVSGFDINNTGNAFVLSRLPERKSGEIFVIELSDISKIQTLVGKKIDTTVFKAGANPGGLKKTRLLDSEGDQMQAENGVQSAVFENGALRIEYAAGCAYLDGEELHLTPIEYKLLCLLSQNAGKVLTHTFITQKIWGSSWENDIASLRVFMATLRKKLEKNGEQTQYIQTHIGVGYRMLKVE